MAGVNLDGSSIPNIIEKISVRGSGNIYLNIYLSCKGKCDEERVYSFVINILASDNDIVFYVLLLHPFPSDSLLLSLLRHFKN